ncbi:unnamed protein product [Lactuca saligna]|uniref:DUF4378 domain-containing protein n=1 Tax=Lactuca saligna TaxID=75948 RepID=A0AA35VRP9_LACSI|nr:unnamed protein product [Lactuca saligna]
MDRVKRRKLKFPCLFGVTDETPKGRTIQSWCPNNATTDHSLFKFQVGKSTSKQSNQNKKRSSSFLAKLMGKNGISSARPISKQQRITLGKNKVSKSDIPPKKITLLKPNNTECFSIESEVITVPSRITFGLNDRLTHSLSKFSEASLISEAKNKMSSSSSTFLPSFQDSNHRMSVCYEADAEEKIVVYSDPFNDDVMVGYGNLYGEIEETGSKSFQEPLNAKSKGTSPLRMSSPIEDVSSHSDHFKRLDARFQDIKKQLHILKIESLSTPIHTKKRNLADASTEPVTWESSFSAHILQSSDINETAPDTIHHPRDPRLFYRIENCFFEGAVLSKSEKHLLYDYIEHTFIKISKSMVAQGESQLMLSELSIEDQVVKVAEEIDIEEGENFVVNNYDKDPEWIEKNQINNLGKLLSDLVLTDLILEVIEN